MAEPTAETKVHIRLTQDMHRRLRTRCAELDVTVQDYVVRVLDQAGTGEDGYEDTARPRTTERRR